jgi:hypothetical protein
MYLLCLSVQPASVGRPAHTGDELDVLQLGDHPASKRTKLYPPTGAAKRPTKGMPRRAQARAPPRWCPGARCLVVSRELRFGGVGGKRVHTLGWCLGPEGHAMITVDDEGLVLAGVARQAQSVRHRQVSPHERQPNDWVHTRFACRATGITVPVGPPLATDRAVSHTP